MSCKHFDCLCYNISSESCDYILIFGHRRGIPGDQCNLCIKHFDDEHKPIVKGYRPRRINPLVLKRLEKAYASNKSVYDIAREVHVSREYVCRWIRKVHPEYNNWGALRTDE